MSSLAKPALSENRFIPGEQRGAREPAGCARLENANIVGQRVTLVMRLEGRPPSPELKASSQGDFRLICFRSLAMMCTGSYILDRAIISPDGRAAPLLRPRVLPTAGSVIRESLNGNHGLVSRSLLGLRRRSCEWQLRRVYGSILEGTTPEIRTFTAVG